MTCCGGKKIGEFNDAVKAAKLWTVLSAIAKSAAFPLVAASWLTRKRSFISRDSTALASVPSGVILPNITGANKGDTRVTAKTVDLVLTCTYEGTRVRNGREEAVLRVVGRVQGRSKVTEAAKGDVAGQFGVDVRGGFVSHAQLKITTELESRGGEARLTYATEVELDRQPGNPLRIAPQPKRKTSKK